MMQTLNKPLLCHLIVVQPYGFFSFMSVFSYICFKGLFISQAIVCIPRYGFVYFGEDVNIQPIIEVHHLKL